MRIWSIGHSTHAFDEFAAVLERHEIGRLLDVRTVPKSRRHPHFHGDALAETLPARGIAYVHLAALGGWRRTSPDSPNRGWRNTSFRGYADYAMTDAFAAGLAELRTLADATPTAMMCSEALWWRCHRRIVADRLLLAGDEVCHINSDGRTTSHEMTSFAVVGDGGITYPPEAAEA